LLSTRAPRLLPLIFLPARFEPSKCNSPVDCCRRGLDRAEPLFLPPRGAKMQTNLQRVTPQFVVHKSTTFAPTHFFVREIRTI